MAGEAEVIRDAAPTAEARSSDSSLTVVMLVLALFVPCVVDGVYSGLGRELPAALGALGMFFFIMSMAVWFRSYCRAQRIPWIIDMAWFLMFAWVVIVPYYILRREGRSGWSRIGLFALTYFAAWATGWATSIWLRVLFGAE